MAAQTSFGRRQSLPPRVAPKPAQGLGPQAEAFRVSVAAGTSSPADFTAWRRSQWKRDALFWGASLALLLPGLICLFLDIPLPLALAVESVGMAAGLWLRRERKRRLKDIAGWTPEVG